LKVDGLSLFILATETAEENTTFGWWFLQWIPLILVAMTIIWWDVQLSHIMSLTIPFKIVDLFFLSFYGISWNPNPMASDKFTTSLLFPRTRLMYLISYFWDTWRLLMPFPVVSHGLSDYSIFSYLKGYSYRYSSNQKDSSMHHPIQSFHHGGRWHDLASTRQLDRFCFFSQQSFQSFDCSFEM